MRGLFNSFAKLDFCVQRNVPFSKKEFNELENQGRQKWTEVLIDRAFRANSDAIKG